MCANCKAVGKIPAQTLIEIGFSPEDAKAIQIFEPKGCDKCNNTGYKGRVRPVRGHGAGRGDKGNGHDRGLRLPRLRQKAKEKGMLTLRMSGLEKIKLGMTSIEEV